MSAGPRMLCECGAIIAPISIHSHVKSEAHKRKCKNSNPVIVPAGDTIPEGKFKCEVCGSIIYTGKVNREHHLKSAKHISAISKQPAN